MAHEVTLTLNTAKVVVAHKDLEIVVRGSAGKMGTLLISKGNIEWLPVKKSIRKHRFTWKQFAAKMAGGKRVKAKKKGSVRR